MWSFWWFRLQFSKVNIRTKNIQATPRLLRVEIHTHVIFSILAGIYAFTIPHGPDSYALLNFILSQWVSPWLMLSQLDYIFLAFRSIREEWHMHSWCRVIAIANPSENALHLATLEQLWIPLFSPSIFLFNSLICPIFSQSIPHLLMLDSLGFSYSHCYGLTVSVLWKFIF